MDAVELRRLRKNAGLTQAELGQRLGLHRDFIGLMERGVQPIAERTALAVTALDRARASADHGPLLTNDPMERIVEQALRDARISYVPDRDVEAALDFFLPDFDVHIEVKRLHTDRVAVQMARAENVIVAQGEAAVHFLADAIRSGLLGPG